MPEYMAPGVYVVEIDAPAKTIEGVPTAVVDDHALREVAATLRERLAAFSPKWTEGNDSDPGVMLLEVFAFLGETLLYRTVGSPERARLHAGRLAVSALAFCGERREAAGPLALLRHLRGWRAWIVRGLASMPR